jgi:hypothetical protein
MKLIFLLLLSSFCFGQSSITVKPSGSYAGSTTGQFKRVYNVITYGAVADGTTDARVAVQTAIEACHDAGGGTVYFPGGTYVWSGTVISYTNVTLIGDGLVSTFIRSGNADTLIAIYNLQDALDGVPYSSNANTLIKDIHLNGHNVGTVGFYANRAANFHIGRTWVDSFTVKGMVLHNTLIGTIEECYFNLNPRGLQGYADGGTLATTAVNIKACSFYRSSVWGVDWQGGGQLSLYDTDFELNGVVGDTLTGGIYYHGNQWPGGLHITGGWAEENLGTVIAISDNVSYQGFGGYPLYTTHSIIGFQDLGQYNGFTKRNIYLKGNYQRLSVIGGTHSGAIAGIVADGNSTTNINVYGSYISSSTIRGGAVLTTTGQ